jgi:hypothetical protein
VAASLRGVSRRVLATELVSLRPTKFTSRSLVTSANDGRNHSLHHTSFLKVRGPPPRLTAPHGSVGARLFCQIFVFRFGCNLLIFNRDELRCFLAKILILNG